MKRLFALVAAVLMVLGALWVREGITAPDEEPTASEDPAPQRIVCEDALIIICQNAFPSTEIRTEPPGTTMSRLRRGGSLNGDLWIVSEPWSAIAAALAPDLGRATYASVARQGDFIGVAERMTALSPTCGGATNWRCVALSAGKSWASLGGQSTWGNLTIGIPPATSTAALLAAICVTNAFFDPTTVVPTDLEDSDELKSAIARLRAGSGVASKPVEQMMLQAGKFSAAFDMDGRAALNSSAQAAKFIAESSMKSPAVRIAIWVASDREAPPDSLSRIAQAAKELGWQDADAPSAALPKATVMDRLAQLWSSYS